MASLMLMITLALLMVAAVSCTHSGQSSSELYWKKILPKTPIPSVIQDLMESNVEKTFSVERRVHPIDFNNRHAVEWRFHWDQPFMLADDYPNEADYILEKDLHEGTTMAFHMQRTIHDTGFLPREVADSIPFSSIKLPEIMSLFNVKPNSPEAEMIKEQLETCESKGVDGEHKLCATSVESMVDFAISTTGTTHLLALSTRPAVAGEAIIKNQEYTIVSPGVRLVMAASSKFVSCHPNTYPYAVYYCHLIRGTKVYEVSLLGKDGSRVRAMVTCHMDTASWNPTHLVFQVLKVEPGTLPVCHFIPEDNVIFAPSG